MSSVLVLNAGYEPLQRVSLRHAVKMVVRGVALIEEAVDGEFYGPFPKPLVLRLISYVQMKWRQGQPKWSTRRLFARDKNQCAYCLGPANTKDHIFPKSRGGEDTWMNTVASCFKCNVKKGNRTPDEANMPLKLKPFVPTWADVA